MNSKEISKQKKIIAVYNMVPNMVWSVICLVPVSFFCYHFMKLKWFYIFILISAFTILLPKSFFKLLQLGKTRSVYKKAGVSFINKFTQNGDIINRVIRKKIPGYQIASKKHLSGKKLLQQTYMFEKFHFLMGIFFVLTTGYALFEHFYLWAFIITITNLIYNVYPIFLQQYIRLRISSFQKKSEHQ